MLRLNNSAIIPATGSISTTVTAQMKDQYGMVMGYLPLYSLQDSYNGVSINSSTGEVTIDSTATAGTVYITASYGPLSASVPLVLSGGSANTYSLVFYRLFWDEYEPCDHFLLDITSTDTAYIYAHVLDSQWDFVTAPELVSIVYTSDSGVENTTGEFTMDELEIDPYGWYGSSETYVTAIATLSDGTVLQESLLIWAIATPPLP